MPVGYSFYRLLSEDADLGSNADITYKLLNPTIHSPATPTFTTSHTLGSGSTPAPRANNALSPVPFDVQTYTGILTLTASLTFDLYALHVEISDNPTTSGQTPLTTRHVLHVLVNRTLPFDMSLMEYDDGMVTTGLLTFRARVLVILTTCSMAAIAVLLVAIVVLRRRTSSSRRRRCSDKVCEMDTVSSV